MSVPGKGDLPVPGMPDVAWLDKAQTHARWTFASSDREGQDRDFDHWCGWFGFDETDEPYQVDRSVWLVRKRS